MKEEYNIELTESIGENYDAVIIAVNHKEFIGYDEKFFKKITNNKGIIVDIKGVYRNKITELTYMSL